MYQNIIIVLVFLSLASCEKEDDEVGFEGNTITFSPNNTEWFLREPPDSIRIQLSGGVAPYIIKNRPDFSSKAIIRGNELLVYPKFYMNDRLSDRLGYDYVNVEDNIGNTNTFNMRISFQEYNYIDTTFTIRSLSDTTIDLSPVKLNYAEYEGFLNILNVAYASAIPGNRASLYFNIHDIDSIGSFKPRNFSFGHNAAINNNVYDQIDSNQTINITKFSRKEIIGNFTIVAKTGTQDEIKLSASFHLIKSWERRS